MGIVVGPVVIEQPRSTRGVETLLEDSVNYGTNKSHDRHKSKIKESAESLVKKHLNQFTTRTLADSFPFPLDCAY